MFIDPIKPIVFYPHTSHVRSITKFEKQLELQTLSYASAASRGGCYVKPELQGCGYKTPRAVDAERMDKCLEATALLGKKCDREHRPCMWCTSTCFSGTLSSANVLLLHGTGLSQPPPFIFARHGAEPTTPFSLPLFSHFKATQPAAVSCVQFLALMEGSIQCQIRMRFYSVNGTLANEECQ